MQLKIRVPATSANLGSGFDSMGLAVSLYNYVWMEEAEDLRIRSRDGVPVPQGEDNMVYAAVKHLYQLCGKSLPDCIWNRKITSRLPEDSEAVPLVSLQDLPALIIC